MTLCYSDIFNQNADFQRAVNLSLDQGSLTLVDKYIPTTASATVMARYLKAVLMPGGDRSSILIGPYGKGKSHTLFVILALLSEYGPGSDEAFLRLADRLDNIDVETADLIRQVRREKIHLLPVIVNDRYLDVRQAFLASIKAALQSNGLMDIMPENYYDCCLSTIDRWKTDFPQTYSAYIHYLGSKGLNAFDFESELKQCNFNSLSIFRECHKTILAGAEFDPLIESDVPIIYQDISKTLIEQTNYTGMFIVFDEFGKYLESAAANGTQFKALQDLAEICSRSTKPRMLISCISHKAISEYASHLSQVQRASFRTVEGRFEPIYFTSTFEGSFSLISGALGRNKDRYDRFIAMHSNELEATIRECDELGCFAGYVSSVRQIVNQCFPMHPLTTLSLMRLSEQAAQNERTLFTFLSDIESPLAGFIRENKGDYSLAIVSMVYDYFHVTIRENSYDKELKNTIIHADSLIPTLSNEEAILIKAIVLFSMVADNCLLSTKRTLMAALQWSELQFNSNVKNLEQKHHIYTRRSDGVICLMRSTTESVRQDIDREILRRSNIDIATHFSELHDPGYTIPRRYNDKFEMVRFFQNVYISAERFTKQPDSSFLLEYGFADGYVIYLIGNLDPNDVQTVLKKWNNPCVAVLLSTVDFTSRGEIEECAAIKHLLEHPTDEVAAEELSYYFEDLLQMVNQTYAKLFQTDTLFVTTTDIAPCNNISNKISILCENQLYPDCPVICHEMMNRSAISGQMKQSRTKVIDAVFNDDDFLNAFQMKTAEGPIVQAVLGSIQSDRMQSVLKIITNYIESCENGKKPLELLYDVLTHSPYGMRKGVIPILLAYCLRDKHQNAVLYNHGQEITLSGESMNALDEHYCDYELLVDKGSTEQTNYIQLLHDEYTPNDKVPNIHNIYVAMCQIVRSLPRSARANRNIIVNDQVITVSQSAIDVRNILIRYDGNAHDVLIGQLPKRTLSAHACADCAYEVINALSELCDYTKRLVSGIKQIVRGRMGAALNQSIRGTLMVWLQKQPANHLSHSFKSPTAALLNVIRSKDDHSDSELINLVAIALTGLPVEDWSDKQVEEFYSTLDAALSEIENVQDEPSNINAKSKVCLSIGDKRLEQALPNKEMEGLTNVAYESVRSTLSEFADSLTTDDKLLILANLMLHVNE